MFIAVVLYILCISISFGHGSVMVLVNRMPILQYSEANLISNSAKELTYRYADGDLVNISCIHLYDNRQVQLNYFIGDVVFSYAMAKSYSGGIGLSTRLQRAHDNSVISCKFLGSINAIINITLILQEKFNDVIFLKVNKCTTRLNANYSNYSLFYLNTESLELECKVKSNNISLETVVMKINENLGHVTEFISNIKPNEYKFFRCKATNKTDNVLRTITTNFQQLPAQLKDNTLLKLNTSRNHTLLTLYAFNGSQVIYYEYEEDEYLTLNCSTDLDTIPGKYQYYLRFIDKGKAIEMTCIREERNKNYILKRKRLSADDNNTSIACKLLYSFKGQPSALIRLIIVRFHMITQYNTSHGQSKVFRSWILAAAGGLIIIVVIASCTVVYYMKYRRQKTENICDEGEEQINENYDSIELCPSELKAQYSVPKRQTQDDAARNQGNQSSSDLNYAVLDIPRSGKVFRNPIDSEESPYAEVNHEVHARFHSTVPHKSKK